MLRPFLAKLRKFDSLINYISACKFFHKISYAECSDQALSSTTCLKEFSITFVCYKEYESLGK